MSLTRRRILRRYLRMSALRQALVLTACLLSLQIVGALLADNILRREFESRIEDELRARFRTIAIEVESQGFQRANYPENSMEMVYFQAEDPPVFQAPEGIFELRGMIEDDRWDRSPTDPFAIQGGHWYYFVAEVAGSVLAIGTNMGQRSTFLTVVPLTFFALGLTVSVIALGFGLLFSLHAQKRLNRMANVLDRVAIGHFEARVSPSKTRDDLDDMALNIDRTLDRLEVLFNQSRNFAANIAHDLKTPLARLRLRLERALQDGDLESAQDNVEAGLKQVDQIIAVFEAFLRIARLEAGDIRKRFNPVRLADLVDEVAAIFGPVAEDAGFEFKVRTSGATTVPGDAVLLTQMLTNLIENVMRHTPRGTCITLVANGAELGVADNGPGIPDAAIPEVTKPSVRLETSRTSSGAGLGLTLVKAIADAHDAQLVFSENPHCQARGLYVRARFA